MIECLRLRVSVPVADWPAKTFNMVSRKSSPVFFTFALFLLAELAHCQTRAPPAQFVFGDSLVDQGNNNNLASLAKANFRPNGIDLPLSNFQPTGRFSNGRIISDLMSEDMGVEPILAYNDRNAHGTNLVRGCNFASAGSGILDDTGNIFIQHITIPQQLKYFQDVKAELVSLLGPAATDELVASAIHSVTIGGNDFINNYALVGSQRARQYPDFNVYSDLLIDTFRGQITELYNLGARKISISNIGPLGCIPSQLAQGSRTGECVKTLNDYAISFNVRLAPMIAALEKQLPGSTLIIADSYKIVMDYVMDPGAYGFKTSNVACCGTGRFNGNIPCTALTQVCANRDEYLFWDPFHPTDRANQLVAARLLNGPTSDIFPINVRQLIAL
ncbi:protein MpCUS [Marchantia polymorpha subsp. ruderalis]